MTSAPAAVSTALQLNDVRKVYTMGDGSDVVALDHATLTLGSDEIVALVGPSGSGKTTLCSIAGGILSATAGTIVVGGEDISNHDAKQLTKFRQDKVGFVFQSVNLVPFLNARENLLVVDELGKRTGNAAKARADQLLEELGLAEGSEVFALVKEKYGEGAVDFVVGTRLVRTCCKNCAGKVKAEPAEAMKTLDAAYIAQQKAHYALKTCVVSGEALEADAQDMLYGNTLVRLCCNGCKREFAKDPGSFLKRIARAGKAEFWADLMGIHMFPTLIVFAGCLPVYAVMAHGGGPLGGLDALAAVVTLGAIAIELIADLQLHTFIKHKKTPGSFITTGLWAWSRHPNYFGEIVLWIGIAVIASSTLRGWQWVTMISPVFVAFLLMRVSGIPILEKRADERWGDDEAYQKYKARTPVLIPRPPATQHERPS